MQGAFSDEMGRSAKQATELLSALANEKRLMILCHLLEGETTVNELAEMVGMNQSALSQQLAKLRTAKLVETRREAQLIHYRLASDEVAQILETLYGIYCDPKARRDAGSSPAA